MIPRLPLPTGQLIRIDRDNPRCPACGGLASWKPLLPPGISPYAAAQHPELLQGVPPRLECLQHCGLE